MLPTQFNAFVCSPVLMVFFFWGGGGGGREVSQLSKASHAYKRLFSSAASDRALPALGGRLNFVVCHKLMMSFYACRSTRGYAATERI